MTTIEQALRNFADIDLKTADIPANFGWFVLQARAALSAQPSQPQDALRKEYERGLEDAAQECIGLYSGEDCCLAIRELKGKP